jgi:hypothetical protein
MYPHGVAVHMADYLGPRHAGQVRLGDAPELRDMDLIERGRGRRRSGGESLDRENRGIAEAAGFIARPERLIQGQGDF